jgi:hypothetical protein
MEEEKQHNDPEPAFKRRKGRCGVRKRSMTKILNEDEMECMPYERYAPNGDKESCKTCLE